jgi:hypothetical protein
MMAEFSQQTSTTIALQDQSKPLEHAVAWYTALKLLIYNSPSVYPPTLGFPEDHSRILASPANTQNLRRNQYFCYGALDTDSIKTGAPPTMSFNVLVLNNHGVLRDALLQSVRGLYEG